MKMENEIIANSSGKVKKISVSVNDMVETDDTLLIIG
jgi:biotin carboxyl carrier protein